MSEEEAILRSVRNNSCQEIEHIIQNKRIPAVKITEAAIKECGFSQGVQCLLREISNALKKAIPDAASTWCGYRPCNPSIPVFVVSLSQQEFIPEVHAVFTKHFSHYDIEFRQDQEPNDEETIASEMLKEMAETRTVDDEMLIVQSCIEKHIKRLMQEHSNLSIVKASTIKTSAFIASDIRVVEQPCIVLYVPVKGIIPFGEKEFEKAIEGIPTDVREGEFVYFVRHKAHEYHKTLKMSCLISTEERQTGTLGGFVDLPDAKNKIGFLTSAHVVLNNHQIKEFRKSIIDQHKFNERLKNGEKVISIYQPNRDSDALGRVYQICIEPGDEKNASVDVAVVEITKNDRIPDSGEFPDGDFKHIGYTKKEPMVFNSGEIDREMQQSHKGCLLIKYGASTGITRGCLNCMQVYAKEVKMFEKLPLSVLYNQINVISFEAGQPFACAGDSGALVFRCDGGNLDNLKVIGMIIGGSTNRRSGQMFLVTPIQEIFKKLGFETRDFKRFLGIKYSHQQGSAVVDTTDAEQTDESQQVTEKCLTRLENAVAEMKDDINEMKDDINEIKEIIKSLKATETGFISSIKNENTTT